MKFEFTVKSKIIVYAGMGAWQFAIINKATTKKIKTIVAGQTKGWHSVKVRATINKVTWDTSIFPSKDGMYYLPLKAEVRKKADIDAGDTVTVRFYLMAY
jgi:hypothetical protein